MPIKVQCPCGKVFAAKEEMAGKTVKCPGCAKPLKIPAEPAQAAAKAAPSNSPQGKPAAAKPAAGPANPAAAKAAKPAAKQAAGARPAAAPAPAPADDLFDEIGLAPAVEGTRPCPGCTEPMPIEAVICIKCGYNTRLGRRMATIKEGSSLEGGHGAVAQDLLDRAAVVMEGDEEEERKKTSSGAPWWVFLILLVALISFAAWMLMRGGGEESDAEKKTGWTGDRSGAVWRA